MRPAFSFVFAFSCAAAVFGQNSTPANDLQWLTDTPSRSKNVSPHSIRSETVWAISSLLWAQVHRIGF
jgi:hypothetical protein